MLTAFDERPDVGMAASKILVHEDPRRIDKAGHLIYPDGQNRGRGSGELDEGQYDRVEEILWPDGCAAMYRRAMLDEIGGFDEDFFAYADDAELGLRARIAGWKCLYIPDAVVRHHRGATLGLRSSRRLELIERNRVLLAAKLFPWSLLWLNGAYYAMRLVAGVWAAVSGQGEVGKYPGVRGKFGAALALLEGRLAGAAAAAAHAAQATRCGTHSKAVAARSEEAHSGESDFSETAHAPGRLKPRTSPAILLSCLRFFDGGGPGRLGERLELINLHHLAVREGRSNF